jgi:type I restriction enzyme, R subunit
MGWGVHGPTEARTRKELIDPALVRAGWEVSDPARVGLEIPVDGFDRLAWQSLHKKLAAIHASGGVTYELETPKGVSDYALYRPNGEIVAVVEAKRTSTDPRLAQAQAEFYVSEIAGGFKAFLPDGPCMRIHGYHIEER